MTEKSTKGKAQVAIVSFGPLKIEGLLLPDGSFGLSSKQACILLLDNEIESRYKDRLTKLSKTKIGQKLIPEGLEFDEKVRIEQGSKGGSPYVDVLRLPLFEKLLRVAEKLGNQKASDLVDDLLGLTLHQLFCDAFNIKFDADDRQEHLKARASGKVPRRTLTDAIKDWLIYMNINPAKHQYYYSSATDAVYLGLFGYTCKDLKAKLGLDEKDSFRDALKASHLEFIADVEGLAARIIDSDRLHPVAAVHEALSRLMIRLQSI